MYLWSEAQVSKQNKNSRPSPSKGSYTYLKKNPFIK